MVIASKQDLIKYANKRLNPYGYTADVEDQLVGAFTKHLCVVNGFIVPYEKHVSTAQPLESIGSLYRNRMTTYAAWVENNHKYMNVQRYNEEVNKNRREYYSKTGNKYWNSIRSNRF